MCHTPIYIYTAATHRRGSLIPPNMTSTYTLRLRVFNGPRHDVSGGVRLTPSNEELKIGYRKMVVNLEVVLVAESGDEEVAAAVRSTSAGTHSRLTAGPSGHSL